jgi:hypothetical protein
MKFLGRLSAKIIELLKKDDLFAKTSCQTWPLLAIMSGHPRG